VQRVAATLAAHAVPVIDMPITGGFLAAVDGALTLMLGGDQAAIARATPAFQSFASTIIATGEVGSGQAAKLAHQLVMSINIMGLLEGLALGAKGGVDPAVMRDILRNGLADSTVLKVWPDMGPRWKGMLKSADPAAPLPNMRKDLHSALALAGELDLPLPLGALVSSVADSGAAIGHDDPRF
jgi:2-hydroxy-3-oxopropionate reductase